MVEEKIVKEISTQTPDLGVCVIGGSLFFNFQGIHFHSH